MNRRKFVSSTIAGLAGLPSLLQPQDKAKVGGQVEEGKNHNPSQGPAGLFPTDLPELEWREFAARGFSKPVCGVVYGRKHRPENGMPLGAMDTGRLDLQTDGTFGYCTIYNSICPQRGPLN